MVKLISLCTFAATAILAAGINPLQAQHQNTANCDEQLISYLHWKETPATEWTLQLSTQTGGKLQYIGALHSDDATHEQFNTIRQAWDSQKPTIAFFEGPDRGIAESEKETIEKFGESGFVRFLAKGQGIKTQSLDPGPQGEVNYLLSLNRYTTEQIKLFYILREASRLRERKGMSEEQIKTTIAQLLQKANSMIPAFANVLPDVNSLQPAYAKYWSAPAN